MLNLLVCVKVRVAIIRCGVSTGEVVTCMGVCVCVGGGGGIVPDIIINRHY